MNTLSSALADVLKDPEIDAKLKGFGAEPIGSTPQALDDFRRAELAKWQRVVKDSGLTVN